MQFILPFFLFRDDFNFLPLCTPYLLIHSPSPIIGLRRWWIGYVGRTSQVGELERCFFIPSIPRGIDGGGGWMLSLV